MDNSQDKPVMRRATELESQNRTADVVKMLLDLKSPAEIRGVIMEKYNIAVHTANYYITKGHKEIKDHHKPKLATIINAHAKKYHDIARRTEVEDPRTSLLAMQGLEKLLRLTGSGEGKTYNTQVNLNLEQVETQELMALLQKIQVNDDEEIIEITEEEPDEWSSV